MSKRAPRDPLRDEETRRRDAEYAEQRLRQTLYEPPEELNALAFEVIGAAIEVHRHLGPGYTEIIYQRALAHELTCRGIRYETQVPFDVEFKGQRVGEYRLDLVVDDRLVIELKAAEYVVSAHVSQALSYLRATGYRLALIINFKVPALTLGVRRVVWSPI